MYLPEGHPTRSDFICAVSTIPEDTPEETKELIKLMHKSIENVYMVLFALEKPDADKLPVISLIAKHLRSALEQTTLSKS